MSKVSIKGADTGTGVFSIERPATNTDRILTLPDEAGTILTSGGAIDVDASAPADSVLIDSSGNLLLGATTDTIAGNPTGVSSTSKFKVSGGVGDVQVGDSGNVLAFSRDGYNYISAVAGTSSTLSLHAQDLIRLGTGEAGTGSESMRIDSSGNLLVGTTTLSAKFTLNAGAATARYTNVTTGGSFFDQFRFNSGLVGSITTNGSSTAYNTSSDYRLKEDWQPVANAITDVKALKPCNFAWKVDGTRVNGFLAHELADVVPEAVHGEKDAVDDEGNPAYQGIDQSKLVPLLTAALQEAIGRIETLESRVATLEGGMA